MRDHRQFMYPAGFVYAGIIEAMVAAFAVWAFLSGGRGVAVGAATVLIGIGAGVYLWHLCYRRIALSGQGVLLEKPGAREALPWQDILYIRETKRANHAFPHLVAFVLHPDAALFFDSKKRRTRFVLVQANPRLLGALRALHGSGIVTDRMLRGRLAREIMGSG